MPSELVKPTNKSIAGGLERLRTRWPQAHSQPSESGDLIIIPGVLLPSQYRQTICTVLFVAPYGFPCGVPRDFYTDIEVELSYEFGYRRWPYRTVRWHPGHQKGNFPAAQWPAWERSMWWNWRLQAWNPNHDSLFTFMKVIQQRFDIDERVY